MSDSHSVNVKKVTQLNWAFLQPAHPAVQRVSISQSGPARREPYRRGRSFCEDPPQGQEGLSGPVLGLLHSSPNRQTPGEMGSVSSSVLAKAEV